MPESIPFDSRRAKTPVLGLWPLRPSVGNLSNASRCCSRAAVRSAPIVTLDLTYVGRERV